MIQLIKITAHLGRRCRDTFGLGMHLWNCLEGWMGGSGWVAACLQFRDIRKAVTSS